jgi:formylglycine-generating enzyme
MQLNCDRKCLAATAKSSREGTTRLLPAARLVPYSWPSRLARCTSKRVLPSDLPTLLPLLIALAPLPSVVPADLRLGVAALASVHAVAELPAACADDMVLVDGQHCPALEYECARFVDSTSPSCAEYAQKPECRHNPISKRFCIDRHEWPNREGERPTVFVTWYQAKSTCESVGKRLCARSEWTLACEGPKRAPYPYGWQRFPSPCNVSRPSLEVSEAALKNPRTRAAAIEKLWQADPIGSHPDCVSAYGVYDLVGNVDEWTDNREESTSTIATLNGGYWGPVRNTCRLTTKTHGPEFQFYQIGFRCCADPLDGIAASPSPPRSSPEALRERAGPDGWPVPVSEETRHAASQPGS